MNYRELGKTGMQVSEIGFGAWQLGNKQDWGEMSEEYAIQLIHEAISQGCNFFDTAPNYGLGKSEELLGKALEGKRDQVIINTKFGHHPNNVQDFDVSLLRQSLEASLKRLNTDYVDSILLHNPPFEFLNGNSPHYELLECLKEEGKIRAYGASVDSSRELFELLETTNSQVIEVMYNIFHQEPAKAFQLAKDKGAGLIIKVPLDSGWLSGKYNAHSTFEGVRSRWSKEQIETRANLLTQLSFLTADGATMAQAALRFILARFEVSTVIPGCKNIEQLTENVSATEMALSDEDVKQIRHLWEKELENEPLPW
ncbi:aldo/keto reductase [Cytobacillus sp. IB215665]|uniref:aldo/keto reductase n=1 Tax=Cytobacillus sp. IB215665 TaxID=3097357 RepID=UPI002A0ED2D9|nr:aldo/keto reductase [Cytobacillus sp. IB215665]MDX8367279.1 aldo/keto reductase [Cytobacillus sp. IB215665]